MIRVVILIQPAALPPRIGLGIEHIFHILVSAEGVTGKSSGMAIAAGKQRGNGQTDEREDKSNKPLSPQFAFGPGVLS